MSEIRTHARPIGSFIATVLDDGPISAPASFLFRGAEPHELTPVLAEAGLEPGAVPVGLSGMLLEGPAGDLTLLDGGAGGRWHEGLGNLPAALATLGHSPRDIDVVVVSHGHPDHLGGLLDARGDVRYPNARHVLAEVEWRFWTSEETLASVDPSWASLAREVLPALSDQLWLTDGPTTVAPGVRTLPAPGHTPGHMGVTVESDGEALLWFGDAFGHPLGVRRPDWMVATDGDPRASERTRRALIELAVAADATAFANHFPFPAVGRVERAGRGAVWRALDDAEVDASHAPAAGSGQRRNHRGRGVGESAREGGSVGAAR